MTPYDAGHDPDDYDRLRIARHGPREFARCSCGRLSEAGHDHCLDAPCVLACDECGPECAEDMRAQDALDQEEGQVTAVLLGQFEVETPEWHDARSRGLGGSEIASVVGLSPWVSPYALWCRKRGEIGPQEVNSGMDWGKRLEPAVCQAFEDYFPNLDLTPAGTYAHEERDWQIANPDRLIGGGIPFDAKTADKNDAWKWGPNGSDVIPPYYRCQLIWYGDVLGAREGYVAVLIGGNDFRTYHLMWTEREAAWLRWQGRKFWRSVVEGRRPPIDDTNSTYEAIRELHPDITPGLEAEVDPEAWAAWSQAAAEIKRLEAVVTHSKSVIADEIDTARYGTFGGERVVIRQSTKDGLPYVKAIPNRGDAA